jgi:hypothetical protein
VSSVAESGCFDEWVIYVEEWVDPKRDSQGASTCLHQSAGMKMTQKSLWHADLEI